MQLFDNIQQMMLLVPDALSTFTAAMMSLPPHVTAYALSALQLLQANCNAKVTVAWLNGTKVTTQPTVSGTWTSLQPAVPANSWPYAPAPLQTGCCACAANSLCGTAWFVSNSNLSPTLNVGNGCIFTVTGVAGLTLSSTSLLTNRITW